MTADIEQIKKKIIYRSNYRGTKEMDKLLGAFTSKYLDQLNVEDLNELIKFLETDSKYITPINPHQKEPKEVNIKPLLKSFFILIK